MAAPRIHEPYRKPVPDRINRADVQQLLRKVVVRPDHDYTREYPSHMPAKITVRLRDGTVRLRRAAETPFNVIYEARP